MDPDVARVIRLLFIAASVVVVSWALLVVLARRLPPGTAKDLATVLPACATTMRHLRRDARVPRRAKLAVAIAGLWVLSPIDLVPEFLPVIGPLDDVIVVALALRYVARRVPRAVLFEAWPAEPRLLERLLPASTRKWRDGDAPAGPACRPGSMWQASDQIKIASTPERVWAIIADFERHPALAGSGEVKAVRFDGPVATGSTFEADNAAGEVGSFVSRNVIDVVEPPRRLVWKSFPPLDAGETPDHQIEVIWSFSLDKAAGGGTELVHSFEVPRPKAGADQLEAFLERTDRIATVKAGMRRTLENIKQAAESE